MIREREKGNQLPSANGLKVSRETVIIKRPTQTIKEIYNMDIRMTRQQAMESNSVHSLTKDILRLSENKDIVDRYYDVQLAARILKAEMRKAIGR